MGKFLQFLTELFANDISLFFSTYHDLSKCQLDLHQTWYVHCYYGDLVWDC